MWCWWCDVSGSGASLDIPLSNLDPTNARYFRSPPFLRLLAIYRLTGTAIPAGLISGTGTSGVSDWSKLLASSHRPSVSAPPPAAGSSGDRKATIAAAAGASTLAVPISAADAAAGAGGDISDDE